MTKKPKVEFNRDPYPNAWSRSHGTYLAGRAVLDGVDALAADMERKWGCGRLRLLVTAELREKFDRQRYRLNEAIDHGELFEVQEQCRRMTLAWSTLDGAAEAAGASRLDPEVWEVVLPDGTVAAIVADGMAARSVVPDGRKMVVYTLDEIAHLLGHYATVVAVKLQWGGATVERVSPVRDPLDAIDAPTGLDTLWAGNGLDEATAPPSAGGGDFV